MTEATMTKQTADIHVLGSKTVDTETLLTFRLDDQTFGISVGLVSEIIDPQKTTRVPNADALAPTLINVRGSIVPVLNLRYRLGMKPAEKLHTSRMLVIDMPQNGGSSKLAIMADEVQDVIEANVEEIDKVPGLGIRWPTECFRGVAKRNEKLVILVHAENAFSLAA